MVQDGGAPGLRFSQVRPDPGSRIGPFHALPGCPRHGNCCQCVRHHRAKDQLPACYFTPDEEKTFDRSIAFFLKSRKG